jgi:hypothetical protein
MAQWNRYEKGYYFLTVVDIPEFLKKLGQNNSEYGALINTYVHILEYEFRGLSGLEDMTGETAEISDGISTVNMINKVTMQSASTFSMNYNERSGSVLTRVNELFLRGVKDPRTQIKHYNGLIDAGIMSHDEVGFESEVFKFLYFTTDNTALHVEKAYYIVAAQPTKAELSMYSGEKGTYEYPELSMEFSGYPITGPKVDNVAQTILNHITSSNAGNYRFHKDSSGVDLTNDTTYGFQYAGVYDNRSGSSGIAQKGGWNTNNSSNYASKEASSRWSLSTSSTTDTNK